MHGEMKNRHDFSLMLLIPVQQDSEHSQFIQGNELAFL